MKSVDKGLMMKGGEPGMKTYKRLLAMLMALVMLTSMLYVSAFAETDASATGAGIAVENPNGSEKEPAGEGTGGSKDQGGGGKTAEGALTSEPNAAPAKKAEAPSSGWVDPPPSGPQPTQGSNTGGTNEDVGGSGPSGEAKEGNGGNTGVPEGYTLGGNGAGVPEGNGAGVPEGNGNGNEAGGNGGNGAGVPEGNGAGVPEGNGNGNEAGGNGGNGNGGNGNGGGTPGVMPNPTYANITFDCGKGGSVTDFSNTARAGSIVRFKTVPETDYSLDFVIAHDSGGSSVAVSSMGDSHSFTMPTGGEDVTVTVQFKTATPASGEGQPGEGVPSGVRAVTLNVTGQGQMRIVDSKGDSTNETFFATGETVYLHLTADPGFELKSLTMNGTALTSRRYDPMSASAYNTVEYDARFTMPDGAATVTAVFGGEGDVVIPGGEGDFPGTATQADCSVTLKTTGSGAGSIYITDSHGVIIDKTAFSEGETVYLYIEGLDLMDGKSSFLKSLAVNRTSIGWQQLLNWGVEHRYAASFTMPGNAVTVEAVFDVPGNEGQSGGATEAEAPDLREITPDCGGGGSIAELPEKANVSDKVQFRVVPETDYSLDYVHLVVENVPTVLSGTDGEFEFLMPDCERVTVVARFKKNTTPGGLPTHGEGGNQENPPETYSVTLTCSPEAGGSISITNTSSTTSGANAFAEGETVCLSIAVNSGYTFNGLTVNEETVAVSVNPLGGGYTASFDMPGKAAQVKASFTGGAAPTTYSVTVTDGAVVGGISVSIAGATVTVMAFKKTNKWFKEWIGAEGLDFTSGNARTSTASFIMPAQDVTLTATYDDVNVGPGALTAYTLEVSVSPEGAGSADYTAENYNDIFLNATSNKNYAFEGWYDEDNELFSADRNYAFTLTRNTRLTARFYRTGYTVSVQAEPAEGGSVSASSRLGIGASGASIFVAKGDAVTVTATAKEGYVFVAWYEGTVEKSKTASYIFTPDGDVALTAVFKRQTSLSAVADKAGNIPLYAVNETIGITCTLTSSDGPLPQKEYKKLQFTSSGRELRGSWKDDTIYISADTLGVSFPDVRTIEVSYPGNDAYSAATTSLRFMITKWLPALASFYPKLVPVNTPFTFSGRILDERNAPVGSVKVTIQLNGTIHTARTDDEGYFFCEITQYLPQNPGSYNVVIKIAESEKNLKLETTKKVSILSTFTVTVSCDPEQGTVTGGGDYMETIEATVKATPKEGYRFVRWTENGSEVSTANPYEFKVTRDRNLTAVFEKTPAAHTVTVNANPSDGGTVTGGGTVAAGQSVTVEATANSGYVFDAWYDGATLVSPDNPYTFTPDGDVVLTANFESTAPAVTEISRLTISNYPADGMPKAGEELVHASFDLTGNDNIQLGYLASSGQWQKEDGTLVAEANTNPMPTADYDTVYVRVLPILLEGDKIFAGSITVDGSALPTGATAAVTRTSDTWAVLKITAPKTKPAPVSKIKTRLHMIPGLDVVDPSERAVFGFIITTEDGQYLPADTVQANRLTLPTQARLDLDGEYNAGMVEVPASALSEGANTLSLRWAGDENYDGCSATVAFTVANKKRLVLVDYAATLGKPGEPYTISGCFFDEDDRPLADTEFTIRTQQEPGSTSMLPWLVNTGEDGRFSYTVSQNLMYIREGDTLDVAILVEASNTHLAFEKKDQLLFTSTPSTQYTVSVQADPVTGGTVTGGGTYKNGESVTLTAAAADGWNFAGWYKGTALVCPTSSWTFPAAEDLSLSAKFVEPPKRFKIEVEASPDWGGTVAGAGVYRPGASVTVIAAPEPGWEFQGWFDGATPVSTEPVYSFNAAEDLMLTAWFIKPEAERYTISVTADPIHGTATGGGTFDRGESVTLHAVPNEGHVFVGWYRGEEWVCGDADWSFRASCDAQLTAKFRAEPIRREVSVQVTPSGGGTVTGAGTYEWGSWAELQARPAEGYRFLGWYENGEHRSPDTDYEFRVLDDDVKLEAKFSNEYTVSVKTDPDGSSAHSVNMTVAKPGDTIKVEANPYSVDPLVSSPFAIVCVGNDSLTPYTVSVTIIAGTGFSSLHGEFLMPAEDVTITIIYAHNMDDEFSYFHGTEPGEGGTVTPLGGHAAFGTELTAVATVNPGYVFDGWYDEEENKVSNSPSYSYYLTRGTSLYARFSKESTVRFWDGETLLYTQKVPYNGHAVEPSPEPSKAGGYEFWGWQRSQSFDWYNDFDFQNRRVYEDIDLYAWFRRVHTVEFDLGGATFPPGWGFEPQNVPDGDRYNVPTLDELEDNWGIFHPRDGVFLGVEVTGASGVKTYEPGEEITVTEDLKIKLLWQLPTYTVKVTGDGNGTGAANPPSGTRGTPVTLSASPKPGFKFKEWQVVTANGGVIDNTTANPAEFTIGAGDPEIKAVFEPITYTVTVTNDGNGTGAATPPSGTRGTPVTLSASPKPGFKFKEWQVVSGGVTVTNNGFTIGTADVEIKAIFERNTGSGGSTGSNVKTAAGFCSYGLTGVGAGVAEYAQRRCDDHQALADQAKALLEKASTPQETLEAWRAVVALWREALDEEYSAFLAAPADEETRLLIEAEREAFFAQLAAHEAALALQYPDDPVHVARRVAEALERRITELCFAHSNGRPLTFDEAGAAILPGAEPCERCRREAETEAEDGAEPLREILCDAHRPLEKEEWQEVVRAQMSERIPEADAEIEAIVRAELTTFEEWLAARKALVQALHPQQPELADEALALAARARALELCEDGE